MIYNRRRLGLALGFLAAMSLPLAAGLRAAPPAEDSAQVSGLLAEAKTEAMQLEKDAHEMRQFARTRTSWEVHASRLDQIKGHVNKLGELITKMNNAEPAASSWQRNAIEQITPLLQDLAANVTSTIKHLSNNQERLMHPPYPAYAAASARYATDLAQLIADYVDYSEAKHRSEMLTEKLGPASE